MMFNYFFAIKYQQSFIFFGIPVNTCIAKTDDQTCTMSGCIATPIDVDKQDSYIWSYMPQLNIQLKKKQNVQLHGGYVCGDKIRLYGRVNTPNKDYNESTNKLWITSLALLSQWSASTSEEYDDDENELLVVQQCEEYIIHFYSTGMLKVKHMQGAKKEPLTSFNVNPSTMQLNRYVNTALVGVDMFIINENKMAKVEKFRHLLVANELYSFTKRFDVVNFNIDVPRSNGTLFCVQETLCMVGGCDNDYEPFSDIYQFDQSTEEWKQCGFCSISRFGASAVVFNGKGEKETDIVFLAGGFKGENTPCSVIEELSVIV